MVGISIREFARRDGCSDTMVRKRLKSGHLLALLDGKLDPDLVGSAWRPRKKETANLAANQRAEFAVMSGAIGNEPARQSFEGIIVSDGRSLWTTPEAERVKENYAALLRQLTYERESAKVVEIGDAADAIRSEYNIIRTRLAEVGSNVTSKLAGVRKPEEAKAIIDAEVYAALADLSALTAQ